MAIEFSNWKRPLVSTVLLAVLGFGVVPFAHKSFIQPRLSAATGSQLEEGAAGETSRVLNRLNLVGMTQSALFAFWLLFVAAPYGWKLYSLNRRIDSGDRF